MAPKTAGWPIPRPFERKRKHTNTASVCSLHACFSRVHEVSDNCPSAYSADGSLRSLFAMEEMNRKLFNFPYVRNRVAPCYGVDPVEAQLARANILKGMRCSMRLMHYREETNHGAPSETTSCLSATKPQSIQTTHLQLRCGGRAQSPRVSLSLPILTLLNRLISFFKGGETKG